MPIGPDTDRRGAARNNREADPVVRPWHASWGHSQPGETVPHGLYLSPDDLGDPADKLTSDGGK